MSESTNDTKIILADDGELATEFDIDPPIPAPVGRMHELMEIFDFSPNDLEANRRGQLSLRQYISLRTQTGGLLLGLGMVAFLCVVAATIVPLQWLVLGFAWATFLYWRSSAVRRGQDILADLHDKTMGEAIGEVDLSVLNKGRAHYRMRVAGETFEISRDAHSRLGEREWLHVYYLPTSKILLSVETVEDKGDARSKAKHHTER
jgi:hypothetical protein